MDVEESDIGEIHREAFSFLCVLLAHLFELIVSFPNELPLEDQDG